MLTELRITDLGIIATAVIEPAAGLTVVTGETGAGKTMVVTGLGLVAGAKSDPGLVRQGQTKASVEARFAPVPRSLHDTIEDLGGDLDGDELLVVRQVAPSRSRSWVAGTSVPAAVATRLGSELVTIHGQSDQVRLGTPQRQRQVLDRAAGPALADLLARYSAAYETRQRLRTTLDDLITGRLERAREADLLRYGLAEIERVDPQPGEDDDLRAEVRRLQDDDDLHHLALTAMVALTGDETSGEATGSVLSALASAHGALRAAAARDDRAQALAEQAAEVAALVADLTATTASYLADLEGDPVRLEHAVARLAELRTLTRKYGHTVDEVIAWAEASTQRLAELTGSDDRIAELDTQVTVLDRQLAEWSDQLTTIRRATAEAIRSQVEAELSALALPQARLEFALAELPDLGPAGRDGVTILFSANPGAAVAPLGKVASGGELSRVRLALEVVLAGDDDATTLVFDEIDAGIGGAVGIEVGRRLARLAGRSQVIVVTHLAQVAAFADCHYTVSKSADGAVTTTAIRRLAIGERPIELARMMGGQGDSASAQAHARELLDLAAAAKAQL